MSRRGRCVGVAACVGALGVLLVALPAVSQGTDAALTPGALTQAILAPPTGPSAGTTASPGSPATATEDAGGADATPTAIPTTTDASGDSSSAPAASSAVLAPGSAPSGAASPAAAASAAPPLAARPFPSLLPPEELTPAGVTPGSASARESSPAPVAPVVVAIGDSIMSGHGLDDPLQSWPELLASRNGWQLTNLADDGTGFVQPGDADDTFQTQADLAVQLNPSIVIIAASNNDLGIDSSDLSDQTMSTLQSLRAALPQAQIIALSAFWGDETPPDELQGATDDIHSAADSIGATFVDIGQPLVGRPDLMQDDDVHPTAAGQELLASAIEADIAAAFAGG